MQLTSMFFTRQNVVGLVLIILALWLMFANSRMAGTAPQFSKRTIENKIPPQVPISIKIKKEKEDNLTNKGNKEWYRDFEMEITNTSNKAIYSLNLFIMMPDVVDESNGGTMVFHVWFGRPYLMDLAEKILPEDKPLQPNEKFTFVISEEKQKAWQAWQQTNNKYDVPKLEIVFNYLRFGDGTGFQTTGGAPFPEKQSPEDLVRCLQKPPPSQDWEKNPKVFSMLYAKNFESPAAFSPVNFFERDADTSEVSFSPDICCPGTSCTKLAPSAHNCVCGVGPSVKTTPCSDPTY